MHRSGRLRNKFQRHPIKSAFARETVTVLLMKNDFQLKLIKTSVTEWFIPDELKNISESTQSQLQFYWLRLGFTRNFSPSTTKKTFGVSKSPRSSQEIENLAPKNFSRFPKKTYYESFPDNREKKNFFLVLWFKGNVSSIFVVESFQLKKWVLKSYDKNYGAQKLGHETM